MMGWIEQHLLALPVLIPMMIGAAMLLLGEQRMRSKVALGLLSLGLTFYFSLRILLRTLHGEASVNVYLAANWPAQFGISLVADQLTSIMLILTALIALAAFLYAVAKWHRAGVHFHTLFQFQLMGLNGAFLTGDLFNLFVYFEILLAASYGLLLHGSGAERVKSGLHYIAVNLVGSLLFLIGVAMIYGVVGTLSMADIAARIAAVAPEDRLMLEVGAAILGIAFLTKAGAWPLNFWLPASYSAASPPSAAIFSLMTKVGAYVILRLSLLFFGAEAGESAGVFSRPILFIGLATLTFGTIGMLSSQNTERLAGFSVIVSTGTILSAVGFADPEVTASALFYLVSSTLGIAAFYLLLELMERSKHFGSDLLAVTFEAFGLERAPSSPEEDLTETEPGVAIPAAMAVLGLCFIACTVMLAGLPPLSSFLAKFSILTAVLNPAGLTENLGAPLPGTSWALLILIIVSGFTTVISFTRFGVRTFWTHEARQAPRMHLLELLPIIGLIVLSIALTLRVSPAMEYFHAAAQALHQPAQYIQTVLGTQPVPNPGVLP